METNVKNESACCKHTPPPNENLILSEGLIESVFKISGADCSDEVNAIKSSLGKLNITSVSVNLMSSTVTVHHPPNADLSKIISAIQVPGVKIVEAEDFSFLRANRKRISLISLAGIFLATGFILEWTDTLKNPWDLIIFGVATMTSGLLIFPKAFRSIFSARAFDMNVLMTVAVIGAFAIKEYSEAATVVFLFSVAELLESFSISRARQAIKSVLKLTPQIAQVKNGDSIILKPVLEVKVGNVIYVRPGDSFPLDGIIIEGSTLVNQASLTGESVPIEKKKGDSVFAGTINENRGVSVEVTKQFQDTKISRIIKLIESAQEEKAPSERFVDQFAKIYTPAVFVAALAVAIIPPLAMGASSSEWFYRALVLLVIACPCALVLATPISVVSGLASMARQGILIKGGKYLEALGKIKALALDKTGTLTEGKFIVREYKSFSDTSEQDVLKIAVALERLSSHPLGKALIEYDKFWKETPIAVKEYTTVSGRGAEGRIDSCLYFVGNHRWTHELGICSAEIEGYLQSLEEKSLSVIIVGHKPHEDHHGQVLGIFGLGDSVKSNATETIRKLYALGLEKIVVLSGDNQKTVDAICKATGIREGVGDLLPEDKVAEIKRLTSQFSSVGMVGDGVNDAPALANSTVGISMGGAGTDAAIETSDVTLMQDDLSHLPKAIEQGRRVLGMIRFNIGFAIATKAIFLILAVVGYSNLWLAVAADMGASIFVTLNALRLLKTKTTSGVQ